MGIINKIWNSKFFDWIFLTKLGYLVFMFFFSTIILSIIGYIFNGDVTYALLGMYLFAIVNVFFKKNLEGWYKIKINIIMGKMKNKIGDMLGELMSEEDASQVFNNLFGGNTSDDNEDYKLGDYITVSELKELEDNSVIHLWYIDDDGELRNDGLVYIYAFDGEEEMVTKDGFPLPLDGHDGSEQIKKFDNSGWTFSIRKVINNE